MIRGIFTRGVFVRATSTRVVFGDDGFWRVAPIIACLAATLLAGCRGADIAGIATNTVGFFQAATVDPRVEPQLGQTVAVQATNTYHLYPDDRLEKYVTLVGLTVASVSRRPDYHYVFGILNTQEINAFSGPGGYVMITYGLVSRCQNEAELAGVLGHEITHVCNQDGLAAYKQAQMESHAAAIVASAAAGQGNLQNFASAAGDVAGKVITGKYDQSQEFAADKGSVHLVTAAGYDPHAYLQLLQRLETLSELQGGGVMSTHPGLSDRVRIVTQEIASLGDSAHGAILQKRFHDWVNLPTPTTPAAMIIKPAAVADAGK
jgi:predicted Zn-dependent protease